MPDAPAHSHNVLPIVGLVREKVAGRDLRPFAKERGIAYSTLRHYYDEHLQPLPQLPRPGTIRQLASALRVSEARVRQAAMDSLEGASPEPTRIIPAGGTLEDAVRADPGLLPEAKDHLLNQIALLRRVQAATVEPPVSSPAAQVLEDAAEALEMATESEARPPVPLRGAAKKAAPRPKRGRR